ncbi:hypothetical protein OOK13_34445 [Streptomyces sp. NBC_00378]|nr:MULTISPECIES: hypothetical protein [unclassified Streptomyces]MCX5113464.1 hypothetical protein [Streptomyces sp. NBC_00378]
MSACSAVVVPAGVVQGGGVLAGDLPQGAAERVVEMDVRRGGGVEDVGPE